MSLTLYLMHRLAYYVLVSAYSNTRKVGLVENGGTQNYSLPEIVSVVRGI